MKTHPSIFVAVLAALACQQPREPSDSTMVLPTTNWHTVPTMLWESRNVAIIRGEVEAIERLTSANRGTRIDGLYVNVRVIEQMARLSPADPEAFTPGTATVLWLPTSPTSSSCRGLGREVEIGDTIIAVPSRRLEGTLADGTRVPQGGFFESFICEKDNIAYIEESSEMLSTVETVKVEVPLLRTIIDRHFSSLTRSQSTALANTSVQVKASCETRACSSPSTCAMGEGCALVSLRTSVPSDEIAFDGTFSDSPPPSTGR